MEKFFNQRNKKIANLSLLADNLGHTIRENVSVFSVNGEDNSVTFVTESGNIIEGNYYFTDKMIFDNIVIESGEIFSNEEKFDSASKNQISLFINSVYSDTLSESGEIFNSIIESWTQKVKFNETVATLNEKKESFNNTFNILRTPEFERFLELSENISSFLNENLKKVSSIPEIRNAVKLSDTVSRAFSFDRMSLDQLKEQKSVEFSLQESSDIYEIVCKQELMKKEILESKKSFDTVWVTEDCISNLSRNIFENNDEVVKRSLVEAFVEIPYIALISKKQLSNTISKNLNTLHEGVSYSKNDLKEYTKLLFEMKKPLRELVSNLLQEKYGINLNNIKESPTFKTLLNTQSIIFESLAKISPRSSVIKECLLKLSDLLKGKNGVEAIDVNEGLRYLFENSGLGDFYNDRQISSTFQLTESVGEEEDIVSLIMNTLISENEDPPVLDPIEQAEEEEEEGVDVDQENVDSEEEGSSDMSTMSTKELMKTLSDIEQMIDQPLEIDDQ